MPPIRMKTVPQPRSICIKSDSQMILMSVVLTKTNACDRTALDGEGGTRGFRN
jgi:hypothetical protein